MATLIKKPNEDKLKLLGEIAYFDVTGVPLIFSSRKYISPSHFIYQSAGEKSGCVNLFKVLQTNFCENNCYYCVNRRDRNCPRIEFEPQELANLFFNYYKKGWVEGLFLSSAIHHNPNRSQEKMLATIEILRKHLGYRGYIHCKILPGIDEGFITTIGKLVSRLSLNLEVPNSGYLAKLSPEKNYESELMGGLKKLVSFNRRLNLKAGITTQVIVGGAQETDKDILNLTQNLYTEYKLKRVYYSAFIPIERTPLENKPACLALREARLYQADFLLRKYNFKVNELIFNKEGNIDLNNDPKMNWALNNLDKFPVEINIANFEKLIRVPGIGRITAKRIIDLRKQGKFYSIERLNKLIPGLRRAQNFITIGGKFYPAKIEAQPQVNRQLFLWEEI